MLWPMKEGEKVPLRINNYLYENPLVSCVIGTQEPYSHFAAYHHVIRNHSFFIPIPTKSLQRDFKYYKLCKALEDEDISALYKAWQKSTGLDFRDGRMFDNSYIPCNQHDKPCTQQEIENNCMITLRPNPKPFLGISSNGKTLGQQTCLAIKKAMIDRPPLALLQRPLKI